MEGLKKAVLQGTGDYDRPGCLQGTEGNYGVINIKVEQVLTQALDT